MSDNQTCTYLLSPATLPGYLGWSFMFETGCKPNCLKWEVISLGMLLFSVASSQVVLTDCCLMVGLCNIQSLSYNRCSLCFISIV
ncbi:hypothetical protein EB796_020608 [Bugula neritina]|uniref:Uncharacterized protein n=1 Tax=Bugula neritina TaxID=10212 RepID=A0A7J7J4G1_BUGNE|nr:hypothetical protein EB796_020608 [Bugula neritina]